MLDFNDLTSKDALNPDMLKLARESRGLTQTELCEIMGIRQGTISKIENCILPFSQDIAERAVSALNYPFSFFNKKNTNTALSSAYYRRNLSLSRKVLYQVEARIDIACMTIERLLNSVDYPEPNLFFWDIDRFGTPEQAARALRERWKVPKGPIHKLIELIENNGILVVAFDFGVDGIDGLAVRGVHNLPVIFFNRNLLGDRRRLTIAHELGHLVLHINQVISQDRDEEKEAFRFGSEFLVPESEFSRTFTKLDLPTLAGLKQYWLVSMRALILKSETNNLITKNQSRYLWAQMAKNNYIKNEPSTLDVPIEEPTLLREVIEVHRSELDYSISEIAHIVSLTPEEFSQNYLNEKRATFKVVRNSGYIQDPNSKNQDSTFRRVK